MLKTWTYNFFSFFISIFFLTNVNYTQFRHKYISLQGGMGVNYGSMPSFSDYLRKVVSTDSIKSFATGVEFFLAGEYVFSDNLSVKIDYSFFMRSSNYSYQFYVFDYLVKSHQPYLFINYALGRHGFKAGLGCGYHFQIVENRITHQNVISYYSSGPSFRSEISYQPLLSKKLSGLISAFVYGNFYGDLKSADGNYLFSTASSERVNIGGFGVGLRLGVGYVFK